VKIQPRFSRDLVNFSRTTGVYKDVFSYVKPTARYLLPILLPLLLCGCVGRLGLVDLVDADTAVGSRKAVVFFVDGINGKVYQELLAEGKLPNIDKYLLRRGCRVVNAVTVIPSITYAVTTSIATGQTTGSHGILGNKFFDRRQRVFADFGKVATYRDLDNRFAAPTIYEILSEKFSLVIQTPLTRGAYHRIDNSNESGTCWFLGLFESVDRWTSRRFKMVGQIARKSQRWPELLFAYFPATDEIGHRWGPNAQRYRESLVNVDEQIGRICKALEHNHLLKTTCLLLITDHGMVDCPAPNTLDLVEFLRENFDFKIALKGPNWKKKYSDRAQYCRRFNAVFMEGGGRRANFYLKNGSDWSKMATPEQIRPVADALVALPGVDIVAYRKNKGVIVLTNAGRGRIDCQLDIRRRSVDEKLYRYQVIDGKDPLGYDSHSRAGILLDGTFHKGREWLEQTVQTEYPDLPVQMLEMFRSHRAGDLVIFAAPGWDFDPHNVGGHGGVSAEEMLIPMVMAGPGIKADNSVPTARIVDVAPTLIEMIDDRKLKEYRFDGESLLKQMRE